MPQNKTAPCLQGLRAQQHLQLRPQLRVAVPGASRAESPCAVEPCRTGRRAEAASGVKREGCVNHASPLAPH